MKLTARQQERYSRHLVLNDIGEQGQEKLLAAKVLVVGAGGLGSPALLYLAAAGIGTIGIADGDQVELSNLQRQVAHSTASLGQSKADSARESILAINPDITVHSHFEYITADNVLKRIKGYDFVIDGSDNFSTKFLLNDACVIAGVPLSHGGVLRFDGQTMTIIPKKTCCYRCVFKKPPTPGSVQTCSMAGILGSVAGMLGTIQATEAIKFLAGAGSLLTDTILFFDAREMEFRKIPVSRQADCPVCGTNPTITEPVDNDPGVCDLEQ